MCDLSEELGSAGLEIKDRERKWKNGKHFCKKTWV